MKLGLILGLLCVASLAQAGAVIELKKHGEDGQPDTVNGKAVLTRSRTAEGNFPVGAEILTAQDDGRRLIFRNMGSPEAPIWREVGYQSGPGAPLVYQ